MNNLHVIDGIHLNFEYRSLGDGDVDYLTILRKLREHRCDAVLAAATHLTPPSGSAEEAMRINHANLKALICKVEAGE